ncbi:WD repeat-containing protein 7 isoform X2 [Asparagus officinalis]|uniref:WD repeat-containing protein 7 isoform X2 n=1 Tax=Asparagus officinalis TaxID=4686 RepID=UPI00098DFE24|nr:WD repeat-containing protein 7 isoform X2 [Asparagus officinalis]
MAVLAGWEPAGFRTLKLEEETEALDAVIPEEGCDCGARDVAISEDGKLLALIFESRCVFKLVADGAEIGEVSYEDMHPIVGGSFVSMEKFIMWSNSGAAVVYSMLSLDGVVRFEPLCEIPAVGYSVDERSIFRFCQFKCDFVRLRSLCFELGDSLLWKPYIEIWSIPQSNSREGISSSILLREGGFPSKTFQQRGIPNSEIGECSKNGVALNERAVSSSMVLSEKSYAPYAVIYGFYDGEIEVVRFINLFPKVNSPFKNQDDQSHSCTSEKFLSGHRGAVLCLAARCITINSEEETVCRVLVSGSADCTVRIWDIDSGNVLSVLHHHIAPVKQIILPPPQTNCPWNSCFLSVGEDSCVSLVSLETLRVERMFPGHPFYPSVVAWDSRRGYIACHCRNISSSSSSSSSDTSSVLYLWDVKSGARERVIRGPASHSMFDHFCRGISTNSVTGNILGGCTSASSLLFPFFDDLDLTQSHVKRNEKGKGTMPTAGISHVRSTDLSGMGKGKSPLQSAGNNSDSAAISSKEHVSLLKVHRNTMHPVKSSCAFPGIATLEFDLSSLMTIHFAEISDKQVITHVIKNDVKETTLQQGALQDNSDVRGIESDHMKDSMEECLLRFSLCFLHLWDADTELDKLLMDEMGVFKPDGFYVASGLIGDRGSLTLLFPGLHATLELWKSSSEFCAMRSLVIVSLAQRMISLSHSSTTASSALAAFYTRNFAEKVPDIMPPLLQLLVSFWQDPSEHVRMAARSLFHCAAPRAIPRSLCGQKNRPEGALNIMEEHGPSNNGHISMNIDMDSERPIGFASSVGAQKSSMVLWLESFEIHEWISWIEGTNQDAMASHILVAAALVVWYPSIVKDDLAKLVVDHLLKLVMSMNDRYSCTAAELLAEGMESTWKTYLGPEIPHLVGDIFFQIECLTSNPANNATDKPALAVNMREALIEILLPSLAMADIPGFLNVIEGQIWATSSDSPVHRVSLKTLIRVVRGSPKSLPPYLDKVVGYVLQTMDPGNLVMRKACHSSSMTALREITRVFPMVGMNESSTRLAVGDAIGDIHSVTIRVYDIESVTKIKVLDASGPLGLPTFLEGASKTKMATAISALSFSPDGEGLVAFSENGLMIRWWSLGIGWWEKLSRNLVPVQCTKLIFVPPWEGFSPNSSRSSIMAGIFGHNKRNYSQPKGIG